MRWFIYAPAPLLGMVDGVDVRDALKILAAYGEAVSKTSAAITYLLYYAAGTLSGWTVGLVVLTMRGPAAFGLVAAAFAVSFMLAGFSSSVILRLGSTLRLLGLPEERRGEFVELEKRSGRMMGIGWIITIAVGFTLAFLLQDPLSHVAAPIGVSLGVGLGYLVNFAVINRLLLRIRGERDIVPLIFGLYLILTSPTYLLLTSIPGISTVAAGFMLLTIHISVAGLGSAAAYLVSMRRTANVILHAARGEG